MGIYLCSYLYYKLIIKYQFWQYWNCLLKKYHLSWTHFHPGPFKIYLNAVSSLEFSWQAQKSPVWESALLYIAISAGIKCGGWFVLFSTIFFIRFSQSVSALTRTGHNRAALWMNYFDEFEPFLIFLEVLERVLPGPHFKTENSYGPDVPQRPCIEALDILWRQVLQGADDVSRLNIFSVGEFGCISKITELDSTLA